jgi:hypothetical protein
VGSTAWSPGNRGHVRVGRGFYRALTVVFSTAAVLAAMRWRQDYYLLIIGLVALAAATVGYQHRRHHRPGDTGHIVGMGTAYVAILTAFYVDNGLRLPPMGPPAGLRVLGTPLRDRSTGHHPRSGTRRRPGRIADRKSGR